MADVGQIRVLRKLENNKPIDCINNINALREIIVHHPREEVRQSALFALINCSKTNKTNKTGGKKKILKILKNLKNKETVKKNHHFFVFQNSF